MPVNRRKRPVSTLRTRRRVAKAAPAQPPQAEELRRLIATAMELEHRTMKLYCRFESAFPTPAEVRRFWFEMAQHESRHFGGLALVASLLEEQPDRPFPALPSMMHQHVDQLSELLARLEQEARRGVTLARAFEIALDIEGSEIEDLVLDLLTALKGEAERERAAQLLIHDLGDLSYMIEKYTKNKALLARADQLIEHQVGRLRLPEAERRKVRGTGKPAPR